MRIHTLLGLAGALTMTASPLFAQPSYTVQEIGVLSGGNESRALAVNNFGFVVGWSTDGGSNEKPVWWNPINQTTTAFSSTQGFASGINDSNIATFTLFDTFSTQNTRIASWNLSTNSQVGTTRWATSGGYTHLIITDLSEDGVASGYAYSTGGSFTNANAFYWRALDASSSVEPLPEPVSGYYSVGWSVTPDGQVIGEGGNTSGTILNAYQWITPPYTPAAAQNFSLDGSFAANCVGTQAGHTESSSTFTATMSNRYSATTIGTLSGFTHSTAYGVNKYDDAVGAAYGSATNSFTWWKISRTSSAFLYYNGALYDLNNLIPSGTGWVLEEARDISDTGYIVGWGTLNGNRRGFLLVPENAQACPGDENEDGTVNFTDLNNVLGNWGERCK